MSSIIRSADHSDTPNHMAVHYHDCHQLIYITAGQICVTVSGREYPAGPGTLVMISRFEEHSIQILHSPYRRYTLQIAPQLPAGDPLLFLLVDRPTAFRHAVALGSDSGTQQLFARILEEYRQTSPLRDKLLELLFLQVMVMLYRAHPELRLYEETELQLVRQLQQQLEAEYTQTHTLQTLAQKYHISASHLSHTFKKVTGSSVMGYLASCRFAAAKRYLAQTELPVSRIVELCGFSDSSNFSRSFKSLTGMTPSQFRCRYQPKQLPPIPSHDRLAPSL